MAYTRTDRNRVHVIFVIYGVHVLYIIITNSLYIYVYMWTHNELFL